MKHPTNRAERRHRQELADNHAKSLRVAQGGDWWRYRHNPTACSCAMCGNPRRNGWTKADKYTLQERKVFQEMDYHNTLITTGE